MMRSPEPVGVLEALLVELRTLNMNLERLGPSRVPPPQQRRGDLATRIWFSTRQAAEYAGCNPQTVAEACRVGTLAAGQPFGGAGGRWRIHRDALDAWISST